MRVRVQYVRRRRVMVFSYGKEFFNEFEIKDSSRLRWSLMRVLISAFSKITDLVSSRMIEVEIDDDAFEVLKGLSEVNIMYKSVRKPIKDFLDRLENGLTIEEVKKELNKLKSIFVWRLI